MGICKEIRRKDMIRRTIEQLEEDKREKLIIDIRSNEENKRETYPGAINIFWEEWEQHMDEIPKDRPV